MSGGSVRLWLARHGETEWNTVRRFQGATDLPLTDEGRRQAANLGTLLAGRSFDGVWSSDLSRAVETARIAVGDPSVDARLREMDFGELEGAVWDGLPPETQAALVRFDGFEAPGGESIDRLRARVVAFCDGLPAGDHLLVTHGGVVRTLRRECGDDGFPANGEVVTLDWSGRRPFVPGRP